MGSVFISYAHQDHEPVSRILEGMEKAGHEPRIDKKFLEVGDSISLEIREQIRSADFVVVCLSEHSARSTWVRHEILETLHRELQEKKVRLLPCLLEKCRLPDVFTRMKKYGRVYEDFTSGFDAAVSRLISRLDRGQSKTFESEQYLKLDLDVPDLEVYLTGEPWDWQTNPWLRYEEMVDGYLLYGFRIEPLTYFKHFILCDEPEASKVRGCLQSAGFNVIGTGDKDPITRKRRLWFTIPDFPVEGQPPNNRWIDKEEFGYPK